MVVQNLGKLHRQDKMTFNPANFKDEDFDEDEAPIDDKPREKDDEEIEEIKEDDEYDHGLVHRIRYSYPQRNILRWLTSKRNRKPS